MVGNGSFIVYGCYWWVIVTLGTTIHTISFDNGQYGSFIVVLVHLVQEFSKVILIIMVVNCWIVGRMPAISQNCQITMVKHH